MLIIPTRVAKVVCSRYIQQHQYDTSYRCLARRAAKTNNILNRIVRRGSAGRRVCMYGESPVHPVRERSPHTQSIQTSLRIDPSTSPDKRLCICTGLLQLAFSLAAFAFFLAASRSLPALLLWQVLKIAVPIYCGAKHQCEKVPRAAVSAALKQYCAAAEEGYQISVDATGGMRLS